VSRSFALRLLETFFRRWWLCLLPVVLLTVLGVTSAVSAKSKYFSHGVLYVESETLLSKLSGTDSAANGAYLTPAQDADARLSSLIGTDKFIRSVIDQAGLSDAVNGGLLTLDQVRGSIAVSPTSANTLQVSGSSLDPQVAFAVANATIDSFKQWVIDASLTDSSTAEQFFNSLAATYKTDRDAKKAALDKYTSTHLEPVIGTRSQTDQAEFDRLNNDFKAADAQYNDSLSKAADARLASAQTRSNVDGRLRLVDVPAVPTVSSFSKVTLVLQLALFVFLGLALSVIVVFVGTIADKSIRGADEVRRRLGVPVLAVVPESRSSVTPRQRTNPMVAAAPKGRRRRHAKVEPPARFESARQLEDHHADL